jgi:hypothetical protein
MPVTGLLGGCSICWGGHGGTPIVSGMTCGTTSSGTWVTRTTKELAFYRRYAPRQVPLATLVKIAGLRWPVEENFQASKTLTGLDEHQVRTWASWHRWVTLAMAALAFLTITAAEHANRPPPPGQIPLTRPEIARLFTMITQPAHSTRLPHSTGLEAWNRNLRTDVSAAVTSLDVRHHLLIGGSARRLQVFPHFLKEAFGSAGHPHDHDAQRVLRAIGKGVRDAPCPPGEATGRKFLQPAANLHRHHAVQHKEHFVLMSVHVKIRSRRQRRQPDLRKRGQTVSLAAGEAEERPLQRRRTRMLLARGEDKRRAHGSSNNPPAGQARASRLTTRPFQTERIRPTSQ